MNTGEYTHSYGLTWGYDEPLHVHVVETREASVLFGAGTRDTAEEVKRIASTHGVDTVVVEHGDPDHYGGIPGLRRSLDVEVAVPAGDTHLLRDAGVEADTHLEPDTTYRGFRTIAAPGHTPDNMAYHYRDTLIAGDTVVGSDSVFAATDDWSGALAVCTPEYNHDDAQARESIPNLLTHSFDSVLVSHGENVLSDGYSEVQELVIDLE